MSYVVLTLGLIALTTLVFQVLTGLRWIHFKGLLHLKVHRWAGLAMLAVVLVHAPLAVNTFIIRIF
jgi:hypothetical protein